jgi:hypothetical protein
MNATLKRKRKERKDNEITLDQFFLLLERTQHRGTRYAVEEDGKIRNIINGDSPLIEVCHQEVGVSYASNASEEAGAALGLSKRDTENLIFAIEFNLDNFPPHILQLRDRLMSVLVRPALRSTA